MKRFWIARAGRTVVVLATLAAGCGANQEGSRSDGSFCNSGVECAGGYCCNNVCSSSSCAFCGTGRVICSNNTSCASNAECTTDNECDCPTGYELEACDDTPCNGDYTTRCPRTNYKCAVPGAVGSGPSASSGVNSASSGSCVGDPECPSNQGVCNKLVSLGGEAVPSLDLCEYNMQRDCTSYALGGPCTWSNGICSGPQCWSLTSKSACQASLLACIWDCSDTVTPCPQLSETQCVSTPGCSWSRVSSSGTSSGSGSGSSVGSGAGAGSGSGSSTTSHASCVGDCVSTWSTCTSDCQTYGNCWADPDSCQSCENACGTTETSCESRC